MPFAGLALGRSVVVGPGEPAPAEWGGCERVLVDALEVEVADRLAAAWRARRSLVIEVTPGVGLDDPFGPPADTVTGCQPWEWSAALDLVGERLHHAVWSNAVDGRGGGRFRWGWGEVAVRLGASTGDGAGFGDADVVLPDGARAVCDGGPFDAGLGSRLGVPVLHRIALEHGSLRPVGIGLSAGGIGLSAGGSGLDGSLASDQLAAVTESRAGARVIAPAGSGKTRVLTARARLLLHEWGVPPEAVALVAYNVRAANEMRDRLSDVPGARIRTLNALGLRLCGRRSTIEELEVRRLLSGLVSFPRRAETDPAAPWIEALGRLRLGLVAPSEVESELPDVSDLDRVARTYRAELAERDVVDFDDQVVVAIERLLADPAFRQRSQRFARILLVDEFQDLTPAHLLLLRLLAGPAGAVYGVGDDDQTIYGYAGASPRWLVDFEEWFPGSGSHSLEVNYRCPAAVVSAAANVLTRNAVRVAKTIRASSAADGGLEVDAGGGGGGPAARTAARVSALVASGVDPAGVAVLARVNASLVPVHVLLRHTGVAVDSPVDRRFLQRGGVRAALAWLAVATAADSSLPGALLREAARRPKRGMSQSLLDLVAKQRSLLALERLAGWLDGKGSSREADKVRELGDDVALVRDTPGGSTTSEILMVVRSKIGDGGLDGSAAALDQWSHGALAAHTDDLDALMELAALEPDPSRFPRWLEDQLAGDAGGSVPTSPVGGVTLASIHAVKGREWPHVVVHHATDGLMPHRLAVDLEEERRVFHVGITRGRDSVCIVAGSPASPYLAEMTVPGEPPVVREPASGLARRAPAAPVARSSAGAAELVPAAPGLVFAWRGHDHAVTSTSERGVAATVAGGPATTLVPYGSVVTVGGRSVLLGHPLAESAWTRLRAWRGDRAKALGKPAFVIFDDKTLRAVAAVLPSSERELLSIGGIGPVKLEAHGAELSAIVEDVRGGDGAGAGPAGAGAAGGLDT